MAFFELIPYAIFLWLVSTSVLVAGFRLTDRNSTTTLYVPLTPPLGKTSDYLSPNLASFSIEFAYFVDFIGNKTHPNELTTRILRNIQQRIGVPLSFRPGGISVDSSIYDPAAPALTRVTSPAGAIYRTVYGPDFFDSFHALPDKTQFVFDLNFGNNSLDIAVDQAEAAYAHLNPKSIWALELGNEPDHYGGGSRNASTWNAVTYTQEFLNWTVSIQAALGLEAPHFVAVGAVDDPPDSLINTVNTVAAGIADGHTVEYVSQHTYQYSTCDPERNVRATLPNLINHNNITSYLDLWRPQIAAAKSIGAPFIVGEFNSVSCSGKANVTDTFGQALWTVDTMLYAASINITRLYLHQGATLVAQSNVQLNTPGYSKYDMWIPTTTNNSGPARTSPSYVSFLLLGEAIGKPSVPLEKYNTLKTGGTDMRISLLETPQGLSNQTFAAYALYHKSTLSRLVILNLGTRNVTSTATVSSDAIPNAINGTVTVDISQLLKNGSGRLRDVTLKRMTSPGLDERDSAQVSWAGQTYPDGNAVGKEVIERVQNGLVTVRASEAVLVFL